MHHDLTPKARFKRLDRVRRLRRDQTPAERLLWSRLRNKAMGASVRRQHPVGIYIADFYVPDVKLVVELDGSVHEGDDAKEYDEKRNLWMTDFGYTVLRFSNNDAMTSIERVLVEIVDKVKLLKGPPSVPPQAEGNLNQRK